MLRFLLKNVIRLFIKECLRLFIQECYKVVYQNVFRLFIKKNVIRLFIKECEDYLLKNDIRLFVKEWFLYLYIGCLLRTKRERSLDCPRVCCPSEVTKTLSLGHSCLKSDHSSPSTLSSLVKGLSITNLMRPFIGIS